MRDDSSPAPPEPADADAAPTTGTYLSAGVDVARADALKQRIARRARLTWTRPGVVPTPGGFAGRFDLAAAGLLGAQGGGSSDPILVSGTDGVGTKLKLAQALGEHRGVGVDCVAMCVNDVLTYGARPLFVLDYIAAGALSPEVIIGLTDGVALGCERAGCALIGGETAQMPGVYADGEYDIAGFAVGAVARDAMLGPERVRPGDVAIGVASSGFHANGFALIRQQLNTHGLDLHTDFPRLDGSFPLSARLLTPTRIYADVVGRWLGWGEGEGLEPLPIASIAHITGGGLEGNVPRALPDGLRATLDPEVWPVPPVIEAFLEATSIARREAFRVFNMGLGLVAFCPAARADEALARCFEVGAWAEPVGRVAEGPRGVTLLGVNDAEG